MKQLYTIISLLFLFTHPAWAQQHEILNQRIRTLQVVGGTNWLSLPVSSLGGEPIHIDFDDMTHDYHRYSYKIEYLVLLRPGRMDKQKEKGDDSV